MRKSAYILAFVLIAAFAVALPSTAAAASTQPKIVIIVGATEGTTSNYRADGNQAYAEAIKYTSNVVRVYSPNATWTKVKAAVKGASIVIYMGHGNGWPSPYGNDAQYTTKDGFGLNATAGNGDSNTKYYGEPSIATLDFAPGAIVLLHHLCYASGNSEPGKPGPTVTVARQRADNYAAGFLKAGAAAVIADGRSGPEGYLRSLFTTHQSIESMWRTQRNAHGHVVTFASKRTPGARAFQDPDTSSAGFYRSLVIRSTATTTGDVVNHGVYDTSADPASLRVPGNAAVTADGARLFSAPDTTAAPAATLGANTRLRVVAWSSQTLATGAPMVQVQGVDDSSAFHGYIAAGDLTPRDSTPPAIRGVDVAVGTISPNGDGRSDVGAFSGRFTESVNWTVRISDAGGDVKFEGTGTGATFSATWDGLVGGAPVADGAYTLNVSALDAWKNGPVSTSRALSVDTVPSQLTALSPDAATVGWFSPNGDGYRDTIALSATNSETGSLMVRVRDGDGALMKLWTVPNGTGPTAVAWDGRDSAAHFVPDGAYIMRVSPMDAVGNTGTSAERTIEVVGALRAVASSRKIFYPQDLDALAKTTTLSFVLVRPMTVTWTLRNAAGQIVDTHLSAAALAAGTTTWTFNGRRADGAMLPAGRYTSYVAATDGALSATQSVAFEANAFAFRPSDGSPARGQTITMRVDSAESLSTAPRLYIYQPGVKTWSVVMKRTTGLTYAVKLKLKPGKTGTVSFKVLARDSNGVAQRTTKQYPLH